MDPIERAAWLQRGERDALTVLAPFAAVFDVLDERGLTLDSLIADERARDNMLVAYVTLAREAFVAGFGGRHEDFAPLVERALDDDSKAVDALCGVCSELERNLPAVLGRAKQGSGGRPPEAERNRGIRILYEVELRQNYPGFGWDNLPYGAKSRLTAGVAKFLATLPGYEDKGARPADDTLRRILANSLKAAPDPLSSGFDLADTVAACACIVPARE